MNRPVNLVTTAHAQAAEFAALAGAATQPADTTALKNALRDALAKQAELDTLLHDETVAHAVTADELAAEKEAHAATQAALDAATPKEPAA